MFFGEYSHTLDAKCRLRLPSKLKVPGGTYVVTKGSNNCLFVFDKQYFDNEFMSKLSHVPTFDLVGQKSLRAFMSSCYLVEEDSQGRWVLPSALKEHAQIDKDIVIVGVGNRMEIWAYDKWHAYLAGSDYDATLSDLAKYDV